jgi:DNA helicase-2/ATP-dependent DNA helicase PcrA
MPRDAMVETVACAVCHKPSGLPPSSCYSQFGRNNPLCAEYTGCRIAEKSEQQLNYVLSPKGTNVFLKACPGSGKTEVVGLKAAYEIQRWENTPGGIAVLTFTNNAADIIKKRVMQFAGIEKTYYPHFIGTIDSWLHGFIGHPFSYLKTGYQGANGDHSMRIVDSTSSSDFLNAFTTRWSLANIGPVSANQYYRDYQNDKYYFSSGIQLSDMARNAATPTREQIDDLKVVKLNFNKHGFFTYQDAENICFELLSDNIALQELLSKRFPFIIIDECQDLSWIQIQILDKLKDKGTVLHFIGDVNQAIYEFKRVSPQYTCAYITSKIFTEINLTNNFRSIQPIVSICSKITEQGNVLGREPANTKPACISLAYDPSLISELPLRFATLLIDYGIEKSNSAILVRGHKTIHKIRPNHFNDKSIKNASLLPTAICLWNQNHPESAAIENAIRYMGKFIAKEFFPSEAHNSRDYYCPESFESGLKWRITIANILKQCCKKDNLTNMTIPWSQWANNARTLIPGIALDFNLSLNGNPFNYRALRGSSSENVANTITSTSTPEQLDINMTTIHEAKGATFDAIMLVSATTLKGRTGGHWSEWLEDKNSENARFAYVASSRPRHLLVWAIPQPSTEENNIIQSLGFHI